MRITHIPTGLVTQCQNDRSQHKNKDQAMKQMKAKLYELEMQKKNAEKQAMEDNKSDIGWGSQIALTCWMTRVLKICVPGWKPATLRRCSMAARPIYRSKFESRVMRNQHV